MLNLEQVRELREKWKNEADYNLDDGSMEKVFETIEKALLVVSAAKNVFAPPVNDLQWRLQNLEAELTPFTAKTGEA